MRFMRASRALAALGDCRFSHRGPMSQCWDRGACRGGGGARVCGTAEESKGRLLPGYANNKYHYVPSHRHPALLLHQTLGRTQAGQGKSEGVNTRAAKHKFLHLGCEQHGLHPALTA
jgi:hypothetical protein